VCQVVLIGEITSGCQRLLQLLETVVLNVALVQVDDLYIFGSIVFRLN
jgi:hypothetical protein